MAKNPSLDDIRKLKIKLNRAEACYEFRKAAQLAIRWLGPVEVQEILDDVRDE